MDPKEMLSAVNNILYRSLTGQGRQADLQHLSSSRGTVPIGELTPSVSVGDFRNPHLLWIYLQISWS
jgi:hypothetical protein